CIAVNIMMLSHPRIILVVSVAISHIAAITYPSIHAYRERQKLNAYRTVAIGDMEDAVLLKLGRLKKIDRNPLRPIPSYWDDKVLARDSNDIKSLYLYVVRERPVPILITIGFDVEGHVISKHVA